MAAIRSIVIIGAGNVGCHLARKLHAASFSISQVAGRRAENVKTLAADLDASYTLEFEKLITGQDLYIIALPDEVMEDVLPKLPLTNELIVHTSGSVPMDILKPYSENFGVLYPLQTFTRRRKIDLKEVPIFVEANRIDNENALIGLAKKLSNKVLAADSVQRQYLHIAAVFASNFSNHMYDIARSVLEEQGLDFNLLSPLILETAAKATTMGPGKAQTGPARRNDVKVMQKHLEMLSGNEAAMEIYRRISESIKDHTKLSDDEL
jgi:predicted short-subunit dehydrogenase-like oxidoreductase (DUF2520 family)